MHLLNSPPGLILTAGGEGGGLFTALAALVNQQPQSEVRLMTLDRHLEGGEERILNAGRLGRGRKGKEERSLNARGWGEQQLLATSATATKSVFLLLQ